jgi:hypothetical protein
MFWFKKKENQPVICDIWLESKEEWIHGLVVHNDMKRNVIGIFVFSEYLKTALNEMEPVKIRFLNQGAEFICSGLIVRKVLSDYEQEIIVRVEDSKQLPNYRKNERFRLGSEVRIKTAAGAVYNGTVEDISVEGILLRCAAELSQGERAALEIAAFPDRTLELEGEILRKLVVKGQSKYALQLEQPDEANGPLLQELIVFLTMQKLHVQKQWKKFNQTNYSRSMQQFRRKM